ncbi:hypothetical protein [Ancylobacter terrae]|uniref:hypothetical protein n=1 Tax=Ancylobacter sp. sgz301288 TaxID=3342077 RepID=UPI00385E36D7
MPDRSFLPTGRAANIAIALGLGAFAWAIYMRYAILEPSAVGLACEAGLTTGTCLARGITLTLIKFYAFGGIAIAAALIHLARPSTAVFCIGLTAAVLGVVLYNNNTAALAAGLLLISFARPWRGATG